MGSSSPNRRENWKQNIYLNPPPSSAWKFERAKICHSKKKASVGIWAFQRESLFWGAKLLNFGAFRKKKTWQNHHILISSVKCMRSTHPILRIKQISKNNPKTQKWTGESSESCYCSTWATKKPSCFPLYRNPSNRHVLIPTQPGSLIPYIP